MTRFSTNGPFDAIDQDDIDLLVEGALSRDERRELVSKLDRHTESWRRCALAFMERDALRDSLAEIRNSRDGEPDRNSDTDGVVASSDPVSAKRFSTGKSISRGVWMSLVGTAAMTLFAAGVGLGYVMSPEASQPLANSSGDGSGVNVDGSSFAAIQNPDLWLQVSNVVNSLDVADGEVIAVVGVSRKHAQTEFLPVIQSESLRQQILDLPKPDVPLQYREQAEKTGWKFDVSRRFLSLNLPDGKNQILPLDTIHYRYVGLETF